MIVNGRKIAREILARVRSEAEALGPVVVRAITVAPSPATLSYLAIKEKRATDAGMMLDIVELPDDTTEESVIAAIGKGGADAVIVQLPLPSHLDRNRILNAIPLDKDADVLSVAAYERFEANREDALLPPVVGAMTEIFMRHGITLTPSAQRITVVGRGRLVGEPCAKWLDNNGGYPVSLVTKEENDYSFLKDADIIVSGAGSPHLITPDMVKEGVVLIDAGTSESDGAIVGDADPACAEKASVFTPVPGGVGPIAVACLFRNALILAQHSRLQAS